MLAKAGLQEAGVATNTGALKELGELARLPDQLLTWLKPSTVSVPGISCANTPTKATRRRIMLVFIVTVLYRLRLKKNELVCQLGEVKGCFKQIVTWSIAKIYRIRREIGVMRSISRNHFLIGTSDREVRERLKENVIYCQKCCNLWDNIPTLMLQILPLLTTHTQPI